MGGCSSEYDLLDSLGGAVLLGAWLALFLPGGLDLLPRVRLWVGALMHTEDLANAGEGVLSLKVFWSLFAI